MLRSELLRPTSPDLQDGRHCESEINDSNICNSQAIMEVPSNTQGNDRDSGEWDQFVCSEDMRNKGEEIRGAKFGKGEWKVTEKDSVSLQVGERNARFSPCNISGDSIQDDLAPLGRGCHSEAFSHKITSFRSLSQPSYPVSSPKVECQCQKSRNWDRTKETQLQVHRKFPVQHTKSRVGYRKHGRQNRHRQVLDYMQTCACCVQTAKHQYQSQSGVFSLTTLEEMDDSKVGESVQERGVQHDVVMLKEDVVRLWNMLMILAFVVMCMAVGMILVGGWIFTLPRDCLSSKDQSAEDNPDKGTLLPVSFYKLFGLRTPLSASDTLESSVKLCDGRSYKDENALTIQQGRTRNNVPQPHRRPWHGKKMAYLSEQEPHHYDDFNMESSLNELPQPPPSSPEYLSDASKIHNVVLIKDGASTPQNIATAFTDAGGDNEEEEEEEEEEDKDDDDEDDDDEEEEDEQNEDEGYDDDEAAINKDDDIDDGFDEESVDLTKSSQRNKNFKSHRVSTSRGRSVDRNSGYGIHQETPSLLESRQKRAANKDEKAKIPENYYKKCCMESAKNVEELIKKEVKKVQRRRKLKYNLYECSYSNLGLQEELTKRKSDIGRIQYWPGNPNVGKDKYLRIEHTKTKLGCFKLSKDAKRPLATFNSTTGVFQVKKKGLYLVQARVSLLWLCNDDQNFSAVLTVDSRAELACNIGGFQREFNLKQSDNKVRTCQMSGLLKLSKKSKVTVMIMFEDLKCRPDLSHYKDLEVLLDEDHMPTFTIVKIH